ncbi:MAG: response regulator [Paenibacillaceae bacterium]|nr:response regulator [Paenibacillaceae bacterium]
MNVIVIDDEPAMHLIMRKMLEKLPEVQVAGVFADTQTASAFLDGNGDVQLAFVDISMPRESGLSFAARMEAKGLPMQIIFVTSHKEFAVKAYELSVLDYLVKPVSQERLERAVNRAIASRREWQEPQPANAGGGRLAVTVLGDVAVGNEAGRVKWISRKSAELFAYLLLHRGKSVPRARLVADIFAGMAEGSAVSGLNAAAQQLRQSLEPLRLHDAVRSESNGYALELGEASVDAAAFEQATAKLQTIGPERIDEALRVERMYTGDLFGNRAYVWAVHETERLAERYESFVTRLAETLLDRSEPAAASKLLVKLHARNPLDESTVRLLMRVHAASRDKKALTAQYADYARLLGRELGIRPEQELALFYDSLVAGMAVGK